MYNNNLLKDTIFKIVTAFLLILFMVIFLSFYSHLQIFYYESLVFLAFILIYYFSLILFITYLNKYKSDKWIVLPIGVLLLTIVLLIMYLVSAFIDYSHTLSLVGAIFSLLILIINIFTIVNITKGYKNNLLNNIFLIISSVIMLVIVDQSEYYFGRLLSLFIFVGILINILFLYLSNKGYDDFVNPEKVYQELIKAKQLLDENIITSDEFEEIRAKSIKYL